MGACFSGHPPDACSQPIEAGNICRKTVIENKQDVVENCTVEPRTSSATQTASSCSTAVLGSIAAKQQIPTGAAILQSTCKQSALTHSPAPADVDDTPVELLQPAADEWSNEAAAAFHREVQLINKLGQGASGSVWLATWQQQVVAVKIIQATLQDGTIDLKQIKGNNEAVLGAQLDHQHIVRTLTHYTFILPKDAATQQATGFHVQTAIVCEYCDLGTLAQALQLPGHQQPQQQASSASALLPSASASRIHDPGRPSTTLADAEGGNGQASEAAHAARPQCTDPKAVLDPTHAPNTASSAPSTTSAPKTPGHTEFAAQVTLISRSGGLQQAQRASSGGDVSYSSYAAAATAAVSRALPQTLHTTDVATAETAEARVRARLAAAAAAAAAAQAAPQQSPDNTVPHTPAARPKTAPAPLALAQRRSSSSLLGKPSQAQIAVTAAVAHAAQQRHSCAVPATAGGQVRGLAPRPSAPVGGVGADTDIGVMAQRVASSPSAAAAAAVAAAAARPCPGSGGLLAASLLQPRHPHQHQHQQQSPTHPALAALAAAASAAAKSRPNSSRLLAAAILHQRPQTLPVAAAALAAAAAAAAKGGATPLPSVSKQMSPAPATTGALDIKSTRPHRSVPLPATGRLQQPSADALAAAAAAAAPLIAALHQYQQAEQVREGATARVSVRSLPSRFENGQLFAKASSQSPVHNAEPRSTPDTATSREQAEGNLVGFRFGQGPRHPGPGSPVQQQQQQQQQPTSTPAVDTACDQPASAQDLQQQQQQQQQQQPALPSGGLPGSDADAVQQQEQQQQQQQQQRPPSPTSHAVDSLPASMRQQLQQLLAGGPARLLLGSSGAASGGGEPSSGSNDRAGNESRLRRSDNGHAERRGSSYSGNRAWQHQQHNAALEQSAMNIGHRESRGGQPSPEGKTNEVPVEHLLRVMATLMDIASALMYLHDQGICHGDLKTSNVLLQAAPNERGYIAKLGDYGCSQMLQDRAGHTTINRARGTPAYVAPELLTAGRMSPAVDIYALGIIMWEMVTCCLPFGELSFEDMMRAKSVRGLDDALAFPPGLPWGYESLARRCWSMDPRHRPVIREVISDLDGIKLELSGYSTAFSLDHSTSLLEGMAYMMQSLKEEDIQGLLTHMDMWQSMLSGTPAASHEIRLEDEAAAAASSAVGGQDHESADYGAGRPFLDSGPQAAKSTRSSNLATEATLRLGFMTCHSSHSCIIARAADDDGSSTASGPCSVGSDRNSGSSSSGHGSCHRSRSLNGSARPSRLVPTGSDKPSGGVGDGGGQSVTVTLQALTAAHFSFPGVVQKDATAADSAGITSAPQLSGCTPPPRFGAAGTAAAAGPALFPPGLARMASTSSSGSSGRSSGSRGAQLAAARLRQQLVAG